MSWNGNYIKIFQNCWICKGVTLDYSHFHHQVCNDHQPSLEMLNEHSLSHTRSKTLPAVCSHCHRLVEENMELHRIKCLQELVDCHECNEKVRLIVMRTHKYAQIWIGNLFMRGSQVRRGARCPSNLVCITINWKGGLNQLLLAFQNSIRMEWKQMRSRLTALFFFPLYIQKKLYCLGGWPRPSVIFCSIR